MQGSTINHEAIMLSCVFEVMNRETFGQRKSAEIVGGLGRLNRLIEAGKIRNDKPSPKKNGKLYCNAADVLRFAKKPRH